MFIFCRKIVCLLLYLILHNTIANDKTNIAKLQIQFKEQSIFGNNDIVNFYREFEPSLTETNINWRVYNLVQTGVLSRIGRGKFTLGECVNFVPQISSNLKDDDSESK